MSLYRVRLFRAAVDPRQAAVEEPGFTVDADGPDDARRRVVERVGLYGHRLRSVNHMPGGTLTVVIHP